MIVSIESINKYFNGEPLLKDVSLTIEEKETVGLIGSNGCGKTTLLNIITGSEGFDKAADGSGSISVDPRAVVGYLRQNSGLESHRTIEEEMRSCFKRLISTKERMDILSRQMLTAQGEELERISHEYSELNAYFEARDGYRIDVRIKQVLSGMGFGGTDTSQIVDTLSGGEKTRLALAKLLLGGGKRNKAYFLVSSRQPKVLFWWFLTTDTLLTGSVQGYARSSMDIFTATKVITAHILFRGKCVTSV